MGIPGIKSASLSHTHTPPPSGAGRAHHLTTWNHLHLLLAVCSLYLRHTKLPDGAATHISRKLFVPYQRLHKAAGHELPASNGLLAIAELHSNILSRNLPVVGELRVLAFTQAARLASVRILKHTRHYPIQYLLYPIFIIRPIYICLLF